MMSEHGSLEPPDPTTTLVVLVGAGEYPGKSEWSNPVLRTSAHAFRDYVLSPAGLSLHPGQLLDLFDDVMEPAAQLIRIGEFLASAAGSARDLVLYYVGHGGFHGNEYYLGVRGTRREFEFLTTIQSKSLALVVRKAFGGKRVYVILDSCFSASAASDFQADVIEAAVRKMAQQLPRRGTAFLAAASKYDVTRAPRTEQYTVFTGAVLEALRRGVESHQPKLSLYELYEEVRELLERRQDDDDGRPELHLPSQPEGDVSLLRVFPNAAYARAEASRLRAWSDTGIELAAGARVQTPAKAPLPEANNVATRGDVVGATNAVVDMTAGASDMPPESNSNLSSMIPVSSLRRRYTVNIRSERPLIVSVSVPHR
jgi:hypothetical protein